MGDFVDGKMFLRSLSRKKAVFLDETLFSRSVAKKKAVFLEGKVFSRSVAKKRGVFLAGKVADKKETPSMHQSSNILNFNPFLLLILTGLVTSIVLMKVTIRLGAFIQNS